jgi:hypothetical protein
MSLLNYPAMMFSERSGWEEVERTHRDSRWYFTHLAMPMSLLPPVFYAYAQTFHPGQVFPLAVPGPSPMELLVSGLVLYAIQLAMIPYMAMLIRRMAVARDHDPGYDNAYALAAIAPVPLWIGALAMAVPSTAFNVVIALLAFAASAALIRHGVRPILHIADEKTAHYVADAVTLAGFAAWIGLMIVAAAVMSLLFGIAAL